MVEDDVELGLGPALLVGVGVSVEEVEVLEVPEDVVEEAEEECCEPDEWLLEELLLPSGSTYCEFPAEPPPPATAVPVLSSSSPTSANAQARVLLTDGMKGIQAAAGDS